MKREKLIGFRVSEYEETLIRSKAKNARRSVSSYVRTSALDHEIIIVSGLDSTLSELRKIGNNINQMTTILHARNQFQPDLLQIKLDFSRVISEISHVLKTG